MTRVKCDGQGTPFPHERGLDRGSPQWPFQAGSTLLDGESENSQEVRNFRTKLYPSKMAGLS